LFELGAALADARPVDLLRRVFRVGFFEFGYQCVLPGGDLIGDPPGGFDGRACCSTEPGTGSGS